MKRREERIINNRQSEAVLQRNSATRHFRHFRTAHPSAVRDTMESSQRKGNAFKNVVALAIRDVGVLGARCRELQRGRSALLSCGEIGHSALSTGDYTVEPCRVMPDPPDDHSDHAPILSLPPEVLAQVFGNLGHLDVVSAAGVCTHWLEVSNSLVLAPRGHLVLHDLDAGASRRHPVAISTIHVVNVRDMPRALSRVSAELQTVQVVWLHQQDRPPKLKTEEQLRTTLDSIFNMCPRVTSVNFFNVPQSAMILRLLIDRGPRPRFKTRCVFVERDHNARGALDVIAELGAFFQEAVVVTLRPVLSITAQYPHYWNPASRMQLPYHLHARALSLHAAGLRSSALQDLGRIADLRVLHLYDAEELDDEALTAIVASVRRLIRLAIHDAPFVSSACWCSALGSDCLVDVERLELSACPQLDDESFGFSRPMERLTGVELDLESCTKLSGAGFQRLFSGVPNAERLTLAVPFSPSIMEGLAQAPSVLPRLKRLSIRVQGSTWQGDPLVAVRGVEDLKRQLRRVSSSRVQMDISLTFIKLGLAVSSSPDDENDGDVEAGL